MKILFTSDLHGIEDAYEQFSYILKHGNYDCGVIAGDNQHDMLTKAIVKSLLNLTDDDLLEVLPHPDVDIDEFLEKNSPLKHQVEALEKDAINKVKILSKARKPVFVITGNHDQVPWKSRKKVHILNNGKSVKFKGYKFIGYQKTHFESSEVMINLELRKIENEIDNKTILITHAPPYGILDHTEFGEIIGEKMLRKIVRDKKPALHLFGHVHESFGYKDNFVNGSYLKEKKFVSIDLDTMDIKLATPLTLKMRMEKKL